MTTTLPVTEADWQATVVDLLNALGWQHLHVRRTIGRHGQWTTSTNLRGWPDLLAWKPGRVVALELKSDRGRPTKDQLAVLASLDAAGIPTRVARPSDFDELARWLRSP